MSDDEPQSPNQTLDLIIVNSGILITTDSESIMGYLSKYNLGVNFNVNIIRDNILNDCHSYETFPKDAVIYTHLAANARFVTLAGVKSLSEDTSSTYYRPDLRFIVSIDQTYLDEVTFIEYCRGNSDLFVYLQRISKNELDPANIVSCTFKRDWSKFFKNEKEDTFGDYFKDYVEKLLKLRAGVREGQTQAQYGVV